MLSHGETLELANDIIITIKPQQNSFDEAVLYYNWTMPTDNTSSGNGVDAKQTVKRFVFTIAVVAVVAAVASGVFCVSHLFNPGGTFLLSLLDTYFSFAG